MKDNNELVTDVTENVEGQATEELVDGAKVDEVEKTNTTEEAPTTTEQVEKTYTKAELKDKINSAVRRREAKIREEYEGKYGKVENVLNAGLGTSNIEEATERLTDFYKQKGIAIPNEPRYSERDIEVLGKAESEDIISIGFDEVVNEVDRLAEKGLENMTPKEKIVFKNLATYRQTKERENELASIGAMKVAEDKEFNNFASQFNSSVPIKQVYEMWSKIQPKPEVEQIGSMKNTKPNEVKDYYTPEEAKRLTDKQLDDPQVMKAVENSMKLWYENKIQ